MKNYLDFKLNGSKIFPYFLLVFLAYIGYVVSYIFYFSEMAEALKLGLPMERTPLYLTLLFVFLFYFIYVFMLFFIGREAINSTSYKGESFKFEGDSKQYLKMSIVGMLLSVVTLGIYGFWFAKKIIGFFAENTSYNNRKFRFNGNVGILVLTVIIPMIVSMIVFFLIGSMVSVMGEESIVGVILILVVVFLMVAVMSYFIYRWILNFTYDTKTIRMTDKDYVLGSLLLFKEIILTICTCGLYAAAMELRISRYFLNRTTISNQENNQIQKVGCEVRMGSDFFYVLGQFLLILITLGIYYPWAISNIVARVLNKTYVESVNE